MTDNVMMMTTQFRAVAVVGMALLVGPTMLFASQDPATASAPRVIEVVARRFTFVPARIEVTEGEAIRLLVKSADGVHGVAIKKFKVNKLVPRGDQPVVIDFVASAPNSRSLTTSSRAYAWITARHSAAIRRFTCS